mgnify:CR=1 FL=1
MNINKPVFFVLIIYPLLIIILCYFYVTCYGIGQFEIIFSLLGYYVSNIVVGIGLHRLWSHDSYKTNSFVEFILAIFAAGTLQGPVLIWASNHFKHHTYTDTDKDPHSPKKYENKLFGFLWSHIGWMIFDNESHKSISRITLVKLGRKKILRWQLHYYWHIAIFMNLLLPLAIGYMIGGKYQYAFAAFIFVGIGRSIQQQATFLVNSICHFVGSQKYTEGSSRDIWWLFFLLLGENWHNFHHAFPNDYRNGPKWYHLDIHKWIIYTMSVIGIAWDLKKTASVRVEAKIGKTTAKFLSIKMEKIFIMRSKVNTMINNVQNWIQELDHSSDELRNNFNKSLGELLSSLNKITGLLSNFKNPSEKIIGAIAKQINHYETRLKSMYVDFEKLRSYA